MAWGAKKVKLADAATVLDQLGYPAGGVPPFGQRTPLPTILDASIVALGETFDVIFAGGGDDRAMLRLSCGGAAARGGAGGAVGRGGAGELIRQQKTPRVSENPWGLVSSHKSQSTKLA